MSININGKLRTPQEREELIDCAVQNFLSKRRMKKAVEPPAKNPRIEPDVSIKILLIVSTTALIPVLRIQKITLKQTETMTQKLTKSI